MPPHSRIPSLNWMRVFEAAARTESFKGAARILNMSAPSVSQQIGALEYHLGVNLFERHPRSVSLTEPGRLLLPSVTQALASMESAVAQLRAQTDPNTVRLGTNAIIASSWLAGHMPELRRALPDLSLPVMSVEDWNDASIAGLDAVLSFGVPPQDWLQHMPLFGETLMPMATPAMANRIRAPQDLTSHRLIEAAGHRQNWVWFLGHHRIESSGALNLAACANSAVAISICASGDGVLLARAPATDWLTSQLGLVPVLPDLRLEGEGRYFFAANPKSEKKPAVQALFDHFQATSKQG